MAGDPNWAELPTEHASQMRSLAQPNREAEPLAGISACAPLPIGTQSTEIYELVAGNSISSYLADPRWSRPADSFSDQYPEMRPKWPSQELSVMLGKLNIHSRISLFLLEKR